MEIKETYLSKAQQIKCFVNGPNKKCWDGVYVFAALFYSIQFSLFMLETYTCIQSIIQMRRRPA